MALLHDVVLDGALDIIITNGSKIDICSAEPANYAGIAAVTLANKTSISVGAAGDRTGGGRKITIAEITDGTCTADGTGTHYAISNGSSALYATQTLDSPQTIANGATFTLAAFDIGIPDPA